jgi:hypothetical protein
VPFHVKTKKGKTWWYAERALQAASDGEDDSDESDGSDEDELELEQSSDDDSSVFSFSDKDKQEVHWHSSCDGCGENPFLGPRWKCEDCDDFDLCGKCYDKFLASRELHTQGHTFCRIPGTVLKNSNGDIVAKGDPDKSKGGFVDLDPSMIWYCGKQKVCCVMIL